MRPSFALFCGTLLLAPAPVQAQANAVPPSTIALPIRVDLDPAFQAAEKAVPKIPPGVEQWTPLPGSSTTVFRFNLYRDPLQPRLRRNQLNVSTIVNYWMEIGVKAGPLVKSVGRCGLGAEGFRKAELGVRAQLEFTPQWTLALNAEPLQPNQFNLCTITFLEVDITGKVMGAMKEALVKGTQVLVEQARSESLLKPRALAVWNQLQLPLELAPGVFLCFHPERIRLAPLSTERNVLVLTPEIQARPTLVFGKPEAAVLLPLPPLEPLKDPVQPGFQVRVAADLPFTEATEQLRRQLAGKRFDTEKGSFEILDCAVKGQADKVLLELNLKGKVTGKLSLVGRPLFDEASGTLKLADLDYTLEAKGWITQVGEWLFRSTLKKTIQEKANFLMDRQFKDLRGLVQQGLNRELIPGLKMNGTLQDLKLGQPVVATDRIGIEAVLVGQVGLDATGLIPR